MSADEWYEFSEGESAAIMRDAALAASEALGDDFEAAGDREQVKRILRAFLAVNSVGDRARETRKAESGLLVHSAFYDCSAIVATALAGIILDVSDSPPETNLGVMFVQFARAFNVMNAMSEINALIDEGCIYGSEMSPEVLGALDFRDAEDEK